MADADRKALPDLIQEIAQRPYAFDFFRALRLLQCGLRSAESGRLAPRLGTSKLPQDDLIRFGQRPSLGFAPSTLDMLSLDKPPKLFVNFFGLFGPNGPMPLHFTDYAIRRQLGQFGDGDIDEPRAVAPAKDKGAGNKSSEPSSRKDFSLSAFCDIFHHRLVSLFFRAWACNQKAVDLDRPDESRFGVYIGSLLGIGMAALQRRDPVPDWAKLYYAGRLASQTRNAEGLRAILEDYFGIPAEIRTFVGRWISVPAEYRCELGNSPSTGCLGKTAIVGDHFYDCQLTFRIRLGPMQLTDVRRLLPDGESFPRLKAWVLDYAGDQYHWDVQLAVRADEVPDSCLGNIPLSKAGARAQLGRTCWLKSAPVDHTLDDIIFASN